MRSGKRREKRQATSVEDSRVAAGQETADQTSSVSEGEPEMEEVASAAVTLPPGGPLPTSSDSGGRVKPADDPFDPARLRLSQDFAANIGVKKALISVPVRRPSKEWWIRVHPRADYWLQTGTLELKEDRELYLVDPPLWHELATESTFSPRAIFTAMTRQGVLFLWPIRLPNPDGRIDDWNASALEAAKMAQTDWVRVTSNMHLGAYDVFKASTELSEPDWPDMPLGDILRVAFKGRFIDTWDHSVLKQLRGEA